MMKTRRINLTSFTADSWPVAIRPARLRKSSKPDRVLHLGTALALLSRHPAKPIAHRATRMVEL